MTKNEFYDVPKIHINSRLSDLEQSLKQEFEQNSKLINGIKKIIEKAGKVGENKGGKIDDPGEVGKPTSTLQCKYSDDKNI